jgi:bisphosphoglycerate-dependent phosphoglycerate mutase
MDLNTSVEMRNRMKREIWNTKSIQHLCDVILTTPDDEKESKSEIKAHRAILSKSTFFKSMFTSGMQEANEKEIKMRNMRFSVLEILIEYIYCEEIRMNNGKKKEEKREMNGENCVELYICSFLFELPGLTNLTRIYIEQHMRREMNEGTVQQILEMAKGYNDGILTSFTNQILHELKKKKGNLE